MRQSGMLVAMHPKDVTFAIRWSVMLYGAELVERDWLERGRALVVDLDKLKELDTSLCLEA